MIQLSNEVLRAFARKGLSVNEGIAVEVRLVKSASRPISTDEQRNLEKKDMPLMANGIPNAIP